MQRSKIATLIHCTLSGFKPDTITSYHLPYTRTLKIWIDLLTYRTQFRRKEKERNFT